MNKITPLGLVLDELQEVYPTMEIEGGSITLRVDAGEGVFGFGWISVDQVSFEGMKIDLEFVWVDPEKEILRISDFDYLRTVLSIAEFFGPEEIKLTAEPHEDLWAPCMTRSVHLLIDSDGDLIPGEITPFLLDSISKWQQISHFVDGALWSGLTTRTMGKLEGLPKHRAI